MLSPVVAHPPELFRPGLRHHVVLAHQDDDLPYAGLLQRLVHRAGVSWLTNGDGLAPMAKMDPEEYAEMRTGEAIAALRILGYREEQLQFLGHSELFFYRVFAELNEVREGTSVPASLREEILQVAQSVQAALRPRIEQADVVWTLAWQGGHPEHDLSHYLAAKTVREVAREQQREIPVYELPAYELTILIPLRFGPWHKGLRHRIVLSDDELRAKEMAFTAYRSQADLTRAFKRLISLYGGLSTLRLKPFSFRQFARIEEFSPVPAARDYTRSPHGWNRLDYPFEEYEDRPVTFAGSIRRFVEIVEAG